MQQRKNKSLVFGVWGVTIVIIALYYCETHGIQLHKPNSTAATASLIH
jgi:hypothetical protein